ncbi:unnamed protein product [Lactuca saligna]|uniref:Alcohol dehydrogenase-like N-terminal domain-containing protein n=1 Tax=Lactuca saligna TaxID=75948 RepID=A0AA36A4H7_LACSI|nr:unnamed protein product [Lactuca saligna]
MDGGITILLMIHEKKKAGSKLTNLGTGPWTEKALATLPKSLSGAELRLLGNHRNRCSESKSYALRFAIAISTTGNWRVVESIGEDVHEVVEGDTVITMFLLDCGECADCLSKKSNLCSKYPFHCTPWVGRDETSRFTDMNGETLYHFLHVSSFTEYTVVEVARPTDQLCRFTKYVLLVECLVLEVTYASHDFELGIRYDLRRVSKEDNGSYYA